MSSIIVHIASPSYFDIIVFFSWPSALYSRYTFCFSSLQLLGCMAKSADLGLLGKFPAWRSFSRSTRSLLIA